MRMTDAGDRFLDDKLQEALDRTSAPLPTPPEGVCKAHPVLHRAVDDVRDASHVLLLCRQEDRKNGNRMAVMLPQKSCKVGPFTFKGFDAADIVKIALVVIVGLLLTGDKVKGWIYPVAQQASVETNQRLNEQHIAMMKQLAHEVSRELIDKEVEAREKRK